LSLVSVGAHLLYSACRALDIETTEKWRARTHSRTHTRARARVSVCEYEDVTVIWDQGVHRNGEFDKQTDLISSKPVNVRIN